MCLWFRDFIIFISLWNFFEEDDCLFCIVSFDKIWKKINIKKNIKFLVLVFFSFPGFIPFLLSSVYSAQVHFFFFFSSFSVCFFVVVTFSCPSLFFLFALIAPSCLFVLGKMNNWKSSLSHPLLYFFFLPIFLLVALFFFVLSFPYWKRTFMATSWPVCLFFARWTTEKAPFPKTFKNSYCSYKADFFFIFSSSFPEEGINFWEQRKWKEKVRKEK